MVVAVQRFDLVIARRALISSGPAVPFRIAMAALSLVIHRVPVFADLQDYEGLPRC